MCGILLTLDGSESSLGSIKHRGIERTVIEKNGVFLCHHRLPIQTEDGDDWNQPREILIKRSQPCQKDIIKV